MKITSRHLTDLGYSYWDSDLVVTFNGKQVVTMCAHQTRALFVTVGEKDKWLSLDIYKKAMERILNNQFGNYEMFTIQERGAR